MTEREQQRLMKVDQQCAVLADVIISIREVYRSADTAQRALIETMIGAAIWYVPKPFDAWTGFISLDALRAFHPNSGVEKPKFSEEHVYPRKVAARLLLNDNVLDRAGMTKVFCEKYGRLHYITSEENKSVQPFQRVDVFTTPEEAYTKAGIVLINIQMSDLNFIRKRNRDVIERYIST
jgi:hypothetical protein